MKLNSSFGVDYLNTIISKSFQECTLVLNDLSKAAAIARSEVEKLLTVLEGPAVTDKQQKYEGKPWEVNPIFVDDSYIPLFKAPPEDRNPTYPDVVPEY